MIVQEFKFTQLSKPKYLACETDGQESFRCDVSSLNQERFDALFELMKKGGSWENAKALIRHEGFKNGIPVNPVFLSVTSI